MRGSTQNSKIALGIIGCGGRGSWIADLFQKHGGYHIVAVADYFPDRADELGEQAPRPASNRFTGLSGYRRLLEQKLDAVAIETPAVLPPWQAADAVAAGKHVYLAKPVAVDVPGCMTIRHSAAKATGNSGASWWISRRGPTTCSSRPCAACTAAPSGRFAFGEATYHAEDPFLEQADARSDAPEGRLRAWGLSRELSGDIITEQNIHTLDVASWVMGQPPVRAFGTGGRKSVTWAPALTPSASSFTMPVMSASRSAHANSTDTGRGRKASGPGSLAPTASSRRIRGQVLIRGKQFYRGGETPTLYEQGAVSNIATFHDAIQRGDYTNATVAESVRSTLVTILGRTAAYKGQS